MSPCHSDDRRTSPFKFRTRRYYIRSSKCFSRKMTFFPRVVQIYPLRLSFMMSLSRINPAPPQKIKWNRHINGLNKKVVSGLVFILVNQLFRNRFIGFVRKIRIFLSSFPDRLMKHTVSEKMTNQKVSFFSTFSMTSG